LPKSLRAWGGVSLGLAGALLIAGVDLLASRPPLAPYQQEELRLTVGAGAALCAIAVAVLLLGRRLGPLLEDPGSSAGEDSARFIRNPYMTLVASSFVALFVEVMLIRYCSSQIRIFSFYKNVPLVGCFLGLGLGCWLGGGRSGHVLRFLLWLVPLTVFLAQGSLAVESYLGRVAATGSSEHILGHSVAAAGPARLWLSQAIMAAFCGATLVAVAGLFTLLGRPLGDAFERVARLPGYTTNILASLAGVLVFFAMSYLQTPPWAWFLVGLAPLFWWLRGKAQAAAGAGLLAISCLAVAPHSGEVVWSRYQKLAGHVLVLPGVRGSSEAYLVQISDVFYQIAIDLRPEAVARLGRNSYPHYDGEFRGLPPLGNVLVVGAGTGNDVAAALRAGAAHVDAVDIDPAIVEMGRRHHPERPYDDPRVRIILDDARRAFRSLKPGSYDAVVFGLLDSHTQLGISSVRLDNYVFTLESLASARRLLKPGGSFVVTAATYREWFRQRFVSMLETVCDGPIAVQEFGVWTSFRCQVANPAAPKTETSAHDSLPVDDWPFLYLPGRSVPRGYLVVVGFLAVASLGVLVRGGLELQSFTRESGHFFLLGAAFLLMEVVAINRLALLFGTTWIVSAVAISLVLVLIVAANITILAIGPLPYGWAYAALFGSLLFGYAVNPSWALERGPRGAFLYGFLILLPVYFAGLVFARSFRRAAPAGPAIGANILGSVLGGWSEYFTMAVGIRAMALLALVFYLGSLVLLRSPERKTSPTA
jgi:SAM-dependent methyltransferase